MSPVKYEAAQPFAPVETYTYTVTWDDGVTASADYKMTVHTDYEDISGGVTGVAPEEFNARRHPYAIDKIAQTDGASLTAGVSQTYAWSVRPRFVGSGDSIAAGRWIISQRTGLDPDQQFANDTTANITASASNVPKDQGIYVQVYDLVTHSWGTANHFNPAGYVGQTPFEFYAPYINQLWGSRAAYLH